MRATQKQLAGIFGVTARTVRSWHDEGLDAHRDPKTGSYDVGGAVQWALEREREKSAHPPDETLLAARTKKESALAGLRELELRRQLERLCDWSEVELFVRDYARRMRQAFEGFADVHGPGVAAELGTDTAATALAIAAEIRTWLTQFSKEVANDDSITDG